MSSCRFIFAHRHLGKVLPRSIGYPDSRSFSFLHPGRASYSGVRIVIVLSDLTCWPQMGISSRRIDTMFLVSSALQQETGAALSLLKLGR